MDITTYYHTIWPVVEKSFADHARFAVVTHKYDLLARGWNPSTHPLVEVLELPATLSGDNVLRDRACKQGYELFLPIVGKNNDTMLAPFDYEVFMERQNHLLYTDRKFQQDALEKYVKPMSDQLEELFMQFRIPYVMDYTPSGFHQLCLIKRGSNAWSVLEGIGYLENGMLEFIHRIDESDIKRKIAVDFSAASVFSGLGRLGEYISLKMLLQYNYGSYNLPATICDAAPRCLNIDLSWAGDSAIMRCMRSPASAHRKNNDRYGIDGNPLVDVIYSYFDGKSRVSIESESCRKKDVAPEQSGLAQVISAMWDLTTAAEISKQYTEGIPYADESLVQLIDLYKKSMLHKFHKDFDEREDLQPGEGIYRFFHDHRLSGECRNLLYHPVPAFLQPVQLRKFVKECLLVGWHPKHIGNGIRDIYNENEFHFPFHKYPAETKGNFYARIFSALALLEEGRMNL